MLRMLLVMGLLGGIATAAPPTKLDRLKVGSVTYSNVTVVNVTPTDLYFSYEKGIKNIKLRLLDPETQKAFNYDPNAAETLEKRQEEDAARFQTTIAARGSGGPNNAAPQPAEKPHNTSDESVLDPLSDRSLIGKAAPAINIDKWLGSAPAPVLKGKYVLLTFLAPWSIASQKSASQLDMVQKTLAGKLEVIALLPQADAENRTLDSRLDFPFAIDEKDRISSALGIENVPCSVLIDPTGIILYVGHPAALGDRDLKMLLAKTPAPDQPR